MNRKKNTKKQHVFNSVVVAKKQVFNGYVAIKITVYFEGISGPQIR